MKKVSKNFAEKEFLLNYANRRWGCRVFIVYSKDKEIANQGVIEDIRKEIKNFNKEKN